MLKIFDRKAEKEVVTEELYEESLIMLTVIMHVYNGADTIEQALNSIFEQKTEYLFKVLVMDDGSTDRTVDIVNTFLTNYDNIELVQNEQNMGICYMIRKAYRMLESPYYCVLDADDYWVNMDKIQSAIDFLQKNSDVSCYAENFEYLYTDNTTVKANSEETETQDFSFVYELAYMQTSSTIFRNQFMPVVLDQIDRFVNNQRTHPLEADNFRNFWAVLNGKIHYQNVVGSVYR